MVHSVRIHGLIQHPLKSMDIKYFHQLQQALDQTPTRVNYIKRNTLITQHRPTFQTPNVATFDTLSTVAFISLVVDTSLNDEAKAKSRRHSWRIKMQWIFNKFLYYITAIIHPSINMQTGKFLLH